MAGDQMLTRMELAELLGCSPRTARRRIKELEESHPEFVHRNMGEGGRFTYVSSQALEEGLLGKVPAAPQALSELLDSSALAAETAAAFEADNDRLRDVLERKDLETAVMVLQRDKEHLETVVSMLQQNNTATVAQLEEQRAEVAKLRKMLMTALA